MPSVARRRSSSAVDNSSDVEIPATPQKRGRRSDLDDSATTPMRKSARLCSRNSPLKDDVTEKSTKSSLKSRRPPRGKIASENLPVPEKPVCDLNDVDQLRAVKEALHVSTAPTTVVCREDEQNKILSFCKECVQKEKAASLYVCGCPGTGKSLSLQKVKDLLVDWVEEEGKQPPNVLSVNCTSFTKPTEIFCKILEHTRPGKKHDVSTSLQALQHIYSQKQPPNARMTLIIVDELDYLITRDRAVLHDLFMLTTLPFSKCILIGIANAIDLADRFIPKLQSLNCKPMVITFRAYSKNQIVAIIQERLREFPWIKFQPQAVELCAMKVSAASGDMRKALSVCRSAIEMLEAERRDAIDNSGLPLSEMDMNQQAPEAHNAISNQTNSMVRIDHVAVALSKTYKSPVVDTIQSLPQHQQMILCSAVKLFRGGKKDTTVGELNKYYVDVCKSTSIPPVGIVELSNMCQVLDDQGILKLGKQSREVKLRRVSLKVDEADIGFALQGVRFFRNFLQ